MTGTAAAAAAANRRVALTIMPRRLMGDLSMRYSLCKMLTASWDRTISRPELDVSPTRIFPPVPTTRVSTRHGRDTRQWSRRVCTEGTQALLWNIAACRRLHAIDMQVD